MSVRIDHANLSVRIFRGWPRRTRGRSPACPMRSKPGVDLFGFEVDDLVALRERLRVAGYHETSVPNAHPHRLRVYFEDAEGNDREVVEYPSQRPAERNAYALEDVR